MQVSRIKEKCMNSIVFPTNSIFLNGLFWERIFLVDWPKDQIKIVPKTIPNCYLFATWIFGQSLVVSLNIFSLYQKGSKSIKKIYLLHSFVITVFPLRPNLSVKTDTYKYIDVTISYMYMQYLAYITSWKH